ncbi:MAG: DUF2278 family protein [Drouetiella hepatica Uher 2000/2452]|jgi:uncharacterized protein YukJ|uniref:DUF2278 family protein n=1 Tax=Drouetiella hepatica Uher 2000/2452 TaxID=904376 RepID=A0A951QBT9_9CYAN|nr:DUF2278 family protein [Drouetiella hepatica Uher 2000/2452]
MSLNYGVLKGRPIAVKFAAGANDHYQIRIVDDTTDYRIAINVKSSEIPPDVLYFVDENFTYPTLNQLEQLPLGFKPLPERKPGGLSLDYIRGNLFDRTKMVPLAGSIPGPENDLNEKINRYVQRALSDETALIYAFGARWGPEEQKKDKYFGFLPGNGIHDIHMNQGNNARYVDDDGVWQDGAMLIHFPAESRWIAVFLKFQSQTWHTDDRTGHAIPTNEPGKPPVVNEEPTPETPIPDEPQGIVRIIAALVNSTGPAPEQETVTLLNTSPDAIDLTDWAIADRLKNKHKLTGAIAPGATVLIALPPTVQLGNKGGLITLLNQEGLKVDGVAYTAQQSKLEGWTVVF